MGTPRAKGRVVAPAYFRRLITWRPWVAHPASGRGFAAVIQSRRCRQPKNVANIAESARPMRDSETTGAGSSGAIAEERWASGGTNGLVLVQQHPVSIGAARHHVERAVPVDVTQRDRVHG